jgi:hypothetical protein
MSRRVFLPMQRWPKAISLPEPKRSLSLLLPNILGLVEMTKSKASDLLVAALESEGVERIFGVPGEENLDVLESLRNSKIKFVITRHEQSATFMGRPTGD